MKSNHRPRNNIAEQESNSMLVLFPCVLSISMCDPQILVSHVCFYVDRHQVTVCKTRTNMKIARWNVRTMHQVGKLQNVKEEAIRLKVDILGLAEVRWLSSGKLVSEDLLSLGI